MKCSCSENQKLLILYRTESELPESLRATVDQCATCRDFFRQQIRMAALLSIKQYERPEATWEERSVVNIQRTIRLSADEPQTAGWMGWLSPLMRVGFAVVALSALTFIFLRHPPEGPVAVVESTEQPTTIAPILMAEAEQEPEVLTRPNPEMTAELWSNLNPRIRTRGAIQLINFEP